MTLRNHCISKYLFRFSEEKRKKKKEKRKKKKKKKKMLSGKNKYELERK